MFLKFYRYRFVCIAVLSLATIILIGNLYYKSVSEISLLAKSNRDELHHLKHDIDQVNHLINNDNDFVPSSDENQNIDNGYNYIVGSNECTMIDEGSATIKTVDMFSKFDFNADWVKRRDGIWQDDFEDRYARQMKNKSAFPLKVFILPHSHTDPGWLKTFTRYYELETSKILDLIVEKLTEYEDMRFIWTEISFLDLWWEKATDDQQNKLKNLVKSGRLEIMTGGWVMTDEANVHLYAMLDQLIEGHQWLGANLGVAPKIGWSIDPFGQGSTVPHLLAKSGFEGAIIQRIHYNWKEWLARHQSGDFLWKSHWHNPKSSQYTLLTHNMPFDIYSTRHSCGPDPKVCDSFDFSVHRSTKTKTKKVSEQADTLIQQYARTASLFPHNVALVLMGSDFTFQDPTFFNDHYFGYKPLIEYINKNSKSRYNGATVQYGTPSDYFNEIKERLGTNFPSLIGDFFPYSDIFSSGTPAYWTGYFTTRPFHKFMSRDLEHNLRNAEILFTIAMTRMKQRYQQEVFTREFTENYRKITEARRNLGLFQHHDAITGTSKRAVMKDYLDRLHSSVKDVISVQQESIEFLLQTDFKSFKSQLIENELIRPSSEEFPTQKVIEITKEKSKRIVIFNSLVQKRVEVITAHVTTSNVRITSIDGKEVPHQINPIFEAFDEYEPSDQKFQLLFLAELLPLSLATYDLEYAENPKISKMTCKICKRTEHQSTSSPIKIENSKMQLTFDSRGFLTASKVKDSKKSINLNIGFESYKSVFSKSGAYLFKPKDSIADKMFIQNPAKLFIVEGPIASEVITIYGELLQHTVRIFNTKTHLDDAILVVNDVNFEKPPKNRDIEMTMKLKTSINNDKSGEPEFFTDQNGFQWLPRRKVPKLQVEGNYYPITSSVFIQDDEVRLTLATTHAQGVTSMQKGELEVMLDRRTAYDDGRGMGEGVMDSVKMQHKFLLSLEFFEASDDKFTSQKYQVPSLYAHHLIHSLNYPVNTYFIDEKFKSQLQSQIEFLSYKFSCDMYLVNLRSLSSSQYQSQSSLLILHRLGYDCRINNNNFVKNMCMDSADFKGLQLLRDTKIKKINEASLTALQTKGIIQSFNDRTIAPMEIKTYLITY